MTETESGKTAQSFLKTGLALGATPGLSIGFTVPKGGDYMKDGVRHFREVNLMEYSIVTFPANDLATVIAAKTTADSAARGKELLTTIVGHIANANAAHAKALGSLEDLRRHLENWYAAGSVNAPNPVGGGKGDVDEFMHEARKLVSEAKSLF